MAVLSSGSLLRDLKVFFADEVFVTMFLQILGPHSLGRLVYSPSQFVVYTQIHTIPVLPSSNSHQKSANELNLCLFEFTAIGENTTMVGFQKRLKGKSEVGYL